MSESNKTEENNNHQEAASSEPQHVRQSSSASSVMGEVQEAEDSAQIAEQKDLMRTTEPRTELEIAQRAAMDRQAAQIERLSREVKKLRAFISKRKQTYKRKRKDEGAPTRALSAYNIFVQDRFSKLAKDNEAALASDEPGAQLKRVPPASLVASTGTQWKELPPEAKAVYEEKALADKRRYENQMAAYQPPEREQTKKRNKTGYNMFFSAYVLQLKQSAEGVPPERGSVARLVGHAWKELTSEEKQYYEREAEKRNELEAGPSPEADSKMPPPTAPQLSPAHPVPEGGMMRHDRGMPEHRLAHSPVHAHAAMHHGGAVPHHQLAHPQFGVPPPGYPQHGHHGQPYYGQGQHGQVGHHPQGHMSQQSHHSQQQQQQQQQGHHNQNHHSQHSQGHHNQQHRHHGYEE